MKPQQTLKEKQIRNGTFHTRRSASPTRLSGMWCIDPVFFEFLRAVIIAHLFSMSLSVSANTSAIGDTEQDVIGAILQWFYNVAAHLQPATFSFLLRATLLFCVPTALCYWSFLRGSRSLLVQWIWCLAGVFIATTIPVHAITIVHPIFKAWVVAISVLLLTFLPAVLPNFLTPTLGAQRIFRVLNYLGLGVLFIINLAQH